MILWAKIYANSGDRLSVQKLFESDFEVLPFHRYLINAMLLRAEGSQELALKELSECTNINEIEKREQFEMALLRGQLLWESNQEIRSLSEFLSSAKLNPNSWVPFLYLGHFYYKVEEKRDLDKASKCYKKCLAINPTNGEAGMMLSDIYRAEGKWEDNLTFLTSITQQTKTSSSKGPKYSNNWAYLRLGMHYLACENYSMAIQNLQSVLRSNNTNIDAWESLADAYAARGSYNAALKAYDKILRLRETSNQSLTESTRDSLYANLQIATIKHKLGHFSDAVMDLNRLLQNEANYVPAIKILGETLLAQANDFLDQGLSKSALDNCSKALANLTLAARSASVDLSCIWILMGEACLMIHPISNDIIISSEFKIPIELLSPAETTNLENNCKFISVHKSTILSLATKCYIRALQIQSDNANCWHNLALTYYAEIREDEQSEKRFTIDEKENLKQNCITSIQRAIQLDPNSHIHWNALGVFEMSGDSFYDNQKAKSLAQHAFIKSIEIVNNSISWTNLGILYLLMDEHGLANNAFKEAQNQEPSYINGWVGQALLAELTGFDEEAMDLFRHTTILGNEPESAIGYAHWICKTMQRMFKESRLVPISEQVLENENDKLKKKNHGQYCIERMFGITVATDCLMQYVDRIKGDPCALNMLGVLLEREGLLTMAKKVLLWALKSIDDTARLAEIISEQKVELIDKIRQSLARVLFKLHEYNAAEEQFLLVTKRDFYGQIGFALSASKNNRHPQDVYNAYTLALEMADGDHIKSQVLAAMATIAYKVQGGEASKTLLFQSCQLQPPSINSLFALLVLGIKQSDANLVGAALGEIERYIQNQPRYIVKPHIADITWLKSLVLVLQGKQQEAKVVLSKAIHVTPHIFGLWQSMALHLLSIGDHHFATVAAKCAKKSAEIKLTLCTDAVSSNIAPIPHQEDIKSLTLVALCLTSAGKCKRKEALKAASKAVHTYPYLIETWTVLLAAIQNIENSLQTNSLIQMKVALSAKIILTSSMDDPRVRNNYNELLKWIANFL
jgi:superkiller protein 3